MSTILKKIKNKIIIIIICERGAILKKKIGEREKHELVSKIPSYQVILLKLMMEWKWNSKWTGHMEKIKT